MTDLASRTDSIDPALPRIALVTGGALRLGREMVLELSRCGFSVAIHCNRSREDADGLAADLQAAGCETRVIQADLSREDEVAGIIPRVVDSLGAPGVLINNASLFEYDSVATASREGWDKHLEPNLRAPFVLSQAFAAALPVGAKGLIVNMLDQRVWNLTQHFVSYTVSKAGLWTLTQTLAMALAPHVRVNAIGPGPALPSTRQSQEDFDAQCQATPLAIGTSPAEIARTLRFFLEAPSVTGQMLALDGGQHLGWAQPQWNAAPPME